MTRTAGYHTPDYDWSDGPREEGPNRREEYESGGPRMGDTEFIPGPNKSKDQFDHDWGLQPSNVKRNAPGYKPSPAELMHESKKDPHEHEEDHLETELKQGLVGQGSLTDGSMTDGKIVGQCPGCTKPIRRHKTAHGDELRHLHNNHVRCFGTGKTAEMTPGQIEVAKGATDAVNGVEHELEKPADEWAYRAESALQMYRLAYSYPEDDEFHRKTNFCGDRYHDHECGLDYGHSGSHRCTLGGGCNEPDSRWWGKDNHMVKQQSLHTADYLGRPDASNPTGRGPDEYKARTWNAFETTKPMQSVEDRNINTPVLPAEPLKTRNINTPTPGLEGREDDLRHSEDDDSDED